ncbi:MAG: hypothetical protein AABX83_03125 [Nanoarchaeota archaeon]
MKRGVAFLVILFILLPFVNASFFDRINEWFEKNVQLAPQQPTDVRLQVGNVVPIIDTVPSISAVNLNPAPSTAGVTFTFVARDRNGAADLVDSTASASFTKAGEQTRTAPCSMQSQAGQRKTYSCTINMQYYDASGVWNAEVSVQDQSSNIASDNTATFTVNLLRDISITPAIIGFPTVAQGDGNITSTSPTIITNNGNFVAPANGDIQITAVNLQGETTPAEIIPAANFKATGPAGAATVCTTGISLVHGTATAISSASLPRGPSGSNAADITYCITSVPEGISTQFYSATGGSAWIVGI